MTGNRGSAVHLPREATHTRVIQLLGFVAAMTRLAADLKPDAVPMKAWGKAFYAKRQANNSKEDPEAYCLPAGVPRATTAGGLPSRIVQTSNLIVILQESKTMFREIFLDGRTLQT